MKPVDKIQKIERRMVDIYENHSGRGRAQQAAERIHNLKLQRWHMMRDSFEWSDENVNRIAQMNERMKEALLDMRRRTIEVYESLNSWCTSDKERAWKKMSDSLSGIHRSLDKQSHSTRNAVDRELSNIERMLDIVNRTQHHLREFSNNIINSGYGTI